MSKAPTQSDSSRSSKTDADASHANTERRRPEEFETRDDCEQRPTAAQFNWHNWLLGLGAFVAVLFIASIARSVLIPIVGALMLSITLNPMIRRLHRHRVPRQLSSVAVMVLVSGLVMMAILAIGVTLTEWVDRAPKFLDDLRGRLATIREPLDDISEATSKLGQGPDQADQAPSADGQVQAQQKSESDGASGTRDTLFFEVLGAVLGQSLTVMVGFLICMVFTFFLLLSGDVFLAKLLSLYPSLRDKKQAMMIVRKIEKDVSRYLGMWTLINMSVGLVVWGAFWLLGVPNALLWGVIAMLLNYIPYAGPWINGALALIMGLLTFDDFGYALLPSAVILGVNIIEGFIISPILHGQRLRLSTVAVLLATVMGGYIWGVAGALMAVPLLVAFYVISSHVPALKTVALFLDNTAPGLSRGSRHDKADASSTDAPSGASDAKS